LCGLWLIIGVKFFEIYQFDLCEILDTGVDLVIIPITKYIEKKMSETANLFRNEQNNFQLNACVGNNGWRGMFAYIDGYQSATLAMLESVLSQYSHNTDDTRPREAFLWSIDTAVYPILFTARHFVEIYIKQKIRTIIFFKIKKDIDEKLVKTHDIKSLWKIFVAIVEQTKDSRLYIYVEEIGPYIQDFDRIDPTGETFRYPYSSAGTMHLEDAGVIGLLNFYNKFNELSKICNVFNFLMDSLVDEYKVGTFTKSLSRTDIEYIAKKLPVYEEWGQLSFSKIKNDLKAEFSIGSKELSDAIGIIRNHTEFKRYIYPDTYELQIHRDNLAIVLSGTAKKENINDFTDEEIASLRTLVELGTSIMDGRYFSEDYENLFKLHLQESELSEYEKKSNYEYSIEHINRLKEGLNRMNYGDIVDSL